MNRSDFKYKLIIGVLMLLLIMGVYFPLSIVVNSASLFEVGVNFDPIRPSDFSKSGNFKFDTNSILESIDNRQPLLFFPETTIIPKSKPNLQSEWTQSDYIKIASAFFEFVWKETLDNYWSIHRMIFESNCSENPAGFNKASIVFSQLIFQRGKFEFEVRAIQLSKIDGTASWGGQIILPRPILGFNTVDLEKIKKSADDVLHIADENGGKSFRQAVIEDCDVLIQFEKNWSVTYFSEKKDIANFTIVINPFTGKIIRSSNSN